MKQVVWKEWKHILFGYDKIYSLIRSMPRSLCQKGSCVCWVLNLVRMSKSRHSHLSGQNPAHTFHSTHQKVTWVFHGLSDNHSQQAAEPGFPDPLPYQPGKSPCCRRTKAFLALLYGRLMEKLWWASAFMTCKKMVPSSTLDKSGACLGHQLHGSILSYQFTWKLFKGKIKVF